MKTQEKVYSTQKEMVLDKFFREVVGIAPRKIKKGDTLKSLAPKKKFEEDFVEMYIDRTYLIFSVNIRKLKNKTLEEILEFILGQKQKHAMYGQWRR